jgi:hypothetical protein
MVIRVFCQNNIYTYRTPKTATIASLKEQLVRTTQCHLEDIVISYLGKILEEDGQSFDGNSIKHNDLLSVTLTPVPLSEEDQHRLNARLAESVMFNSSELGLSSPASSKQQLITKTVRKSYLEPHYGSPQEPIKQPSEKPSNEIRVCSEKIIRRQSGSSKMIKDSLFTKNKIIETESINLDDSNLEDEEEKEKWTECTIELVNHDHTQ